MIAVAEFAQGAMENWGLITYRDILLLNDEGQTTAKNMEQTAKVPRLPRASISDE